MEFELRRIITISPINKRKKTFF